MYYTSKEIDKIIQILADDSKKFTERYNEAVKQWESMGNRESGAVYFVSPSNDFQFEIFLMTLISLDYTELIDLMRNPLFNNQLLSKLNHAEIELSTVGMGKLEKLAYRKQFALKKNEELSKIYNENRKGWI